jgi:putative selenate reductase molybdopterin-binding subunit
MAVASYMSKESPPPFAVQFAEVTVDTETGQVTVDVGDGQDSGGS